MAIAISILLALIAGITIMFQTQYFWGKEDNPNIASINTSMTNFNSAYGLMPIVVVLVLALIIGLIMCTMRGF